MKTEDSHVPKRHATVLDWGIVYVVALVVAALTYATGLPGGLVFGSTIGAVFIALVRDRTWLIPTWSRSAVMIAMGTLVGLGVTPETLEVLPRTIGSAVLAAVLLVVAGLVVVVLLRWVGLAPAGDVLATSPGALEVLTVLAADRDEGVVEVALFHMVRVVLVVLSVPFLLQLLG